MTHGEANVRKIFLNCLSVKLRHTNFRNVVTIYHSARHIPENSHSDTATPREPQILQNRSCLLTSQVFSSYLRLVHLVAN